jgi:hypothetical protein
MDVAGSAVGIASLGIQVCQGLLSYYYSWKSYTTHISTACDCIADLCQTFMLLQESLGAAGLDPARATRVKTCLASCVGGLDQLQSKLQKLQTHSIPSGFREKAWAKVERSFYPFRESTLVKLREIVNDLRDRLSLALQVLQLDLSIESQNDLTEIQADVKDAVASFQRLLTAQQADQFRKIVGWLSPYDPWTDHASARRHHEPNTGRWLLQSDQYTRWKGGQSRHLWLYGKAGCGKTILSSTVIEDLRLHFRDAVNAGLGIFYFTFSDNRKQSFESLLCSLVAQLGWKEPARSTLQQAYDKPNRSLPGPEALEEILLSSIAQYDDVFLALDALDECPEGEDVRQHMLDGLERLSEKAPNLRIFATSRDLQSIEECMHTLEAVVVSISTRPVDADIRRYVLSELSRDRKLSRLDEPTKVLIMKTFAEKADGM